MELRDNIEDIMKEIQLECNTDEEIIKMVHYGDYNLNDDEKMYILRMLV